MNVSEIYEIHEKVLNYLQVMSRPLNMHHPKAEPLWSALYVDLADRKLANWLWNKFEGNRQRDVFVKFANDEYDRLSLILKDSSHFGMQTMHVSLGFNFNFRFNRTIHCRSTRNIGKIENTAT